MTRAPRSHRQDQLQNVTGPRNSQDALAASVTPLDIREPEDVTSSAAEDPGTPPGRRNRSRTMSQSMLSPLPEVVSPVATPLPEDWPANTPVRPLPERPGGKKRNSRDGNGNPTTTTSAPTSPANRDTVMMMQRTPPSGSAVSPDQVAIAGFTPQTVLSPGGVNISGLDLSPENVDGGDAATMTVPPVPESLADPTDHRPTSPPKQTKKRRSRGTAENPRHRAGSDADVSGPDISTARASSSASAAPVANPRLEASSEQQPGLQRKRSSKIQPLALNFHIQAEQQLQSPDVQTGAMAAMHTSGSEQSLGGTTNTSSSESYHDTLGGTSTLSSVASQDPQELLFANPSAADSHMVRALTKRGACQPFRPRESAIREECSLESMSGGSPDHHRRQIGSSSSAGPISTAAPSSSNNSSSRLSGI